MSIQIINSFIKLVGLYFCIGYTYFKLINFKNNKNLILIVLSIIFSLTTIIFQNYAPNSLIIIIDCIIYNIFLSYTSKNLFGFSLIVLTLASSISFVMFTISITVVATFGATLAPFKINYIMYAVANVCEILFISLIFKINRLKSGIPYLTNKANNNFIDIFTIILSIIIIFIYFFITSYTRNSISNLYLWMIFFSVLMFPIIQKTIFFYQKQKLQIKTLKDYEQELNETKLKLSTALEEKQKLIKSNHEFYHRQEALKKKLDDLINQQNLSTNTEFGEDYGNLLDRINKLSDEYVAKTKITPNLTKTNITEIDDMLIYMQSECDKNNIEFILKIDCNVQYIIDNFISKSQLETLLGDLIRNAIIAINHSKNNYKSIMVVLGIKDGSYELCIYDSGIHFEINTLLNLGLKPASTHESEGGTGIGFITTFETIDSCNASFIINELTHNNYTKSLEIKFDNKHDYIIISNRCEEINKMNTLKRNIIVRK